MLRLAFQAMSIFKKPFQCLQVSGFIFSIYVDIEFCDGHYVLLSFRVFFNNAVLVFNACG